MSWLEPSALSTKSGRFDNNILEQSCADLLRVDHNYSILDCDSGQACAMHS